MNITPDFKQKLKLLLALGKRHEVSALLQKNLGVGISEAEQLIGALEVEMQASATQTKSAGARAGGCALIVLRALAVVMGFLTLSFLAATLYTGYTAYRFTRSAVRVTGTVTEWIKQSESQNVVAPLITYTYNSKEYTYQSSTFRFPPEYQINEKVNLLLDAENPEEAQIDSFEDIYATSLGFGFITVFLLMMFASNRQLSRKLKKILESK